MRFRTLLEALCWMNRVSSPGMIEKLCQLRIEPGELVISSWFPEVTVVTWPATICIPVGLAAASPANRHRKAVASVVRRRISNERLSVGCARGGRTNGGCDAGTRARDRREPALVRLPRLLEDIAASSVISISQGQHGVQALIAFFLRVRRAHDVAVIQLQGHISAAGEPKPDARAVDGLVSRLAR